VASNSQTFRELQSLREELSTTRSERPSVAEPRTANAEPAANGSEATTPAPLKGVREEGQKGKDVRELVDEVVSFFEETEKTMATRPAAIAIGAAVVGMIIGWTLGRRQGDRP
jgi:ElaB/YqjD/DUF883 family membrane-anchored ribosome-binding protein